MLRRLPKLLPLVTRGRSFAADVRKKRTRLPRAVLQGTADNANDYIRDAVRRKRPFLAHQDGRSLTIFAEWLVEAKILSVTPLAGVKVPPQPNTRPPRSSRHST